MLGSGRIQTESESGKDGNTVMQEAFERTRRLLGEAALNRLQHAHVAVFGLGGVGGYVCEALIRSGVGKLTLVDHDRVAESNLNRQIIATTHSLGRAKTEVMKEHLLSIAPDAGLQVRDCFFLPENAEDFPFTSYDYVADAMDTVSAKIALALRCRETGTPLISAMGAGNKLDPTRLRISDLYDTSVCPLARVLRRELKKRGMEKLKVVWSDEPPLTAASPKEDPRSAEPSCKKAPGSAIFVPGAMGLIMGAEIVKDLIR